MVELIIKIGEGYYDTFHTMYFDSREEMFRFIKKLDVVSSKKFTYEWEDLETFSEHKLTEHRQ